MQDTGSSISPNVDIGQIEGAFVMGIGLWLSEELKYDSNSGRLLNRDTWVRSLSFPCLLCDMHEPLWPFLEKVSPQRILRKPNYRAK